MFNPVKITDVVQVPALIPKEDFDFDFFNRLEKYLKEVAYIHQIERKDYWLRFVAPPFRFVWNGWNLFNPISHGEITSIRRGKYFNLLFKIWSWEFFGYSVLFSTIAIYGFFPSMFFRFLYLAIIWLFYFFNFYWSRNRLRKLLFTIANDVIQDYLTGMEGQQKTAVG